LVRVVRRIANDNRDFCSVLTFHPLHVFIRDASKKVELLTAPYAEPGYIIEGVDKTQSRELGIGLRKCRVGRFNVQVCDIVGEDGDLTFGKSPRL
jgi:hypothetical protein